MNRPSLKAYYEQSNYITSSDDARNSYIPYLIGEKKTVLDIGCNNGIISSKVKNEYNNVIGCDLSSRLLSEAKEKKIDVVLADAEHLPFKESIFDAIIMAEILEHLLKPESSLKDAYRVLKKRGEIVVTVPNLNSLYNRLAILVGKMGSLNNHEHLRFFNINKICTSLRLNGFTILIKKHSMITVPIGWFKIPFSLFSLGDSIIIKARKKGNE